LLIAAAMACQFLSGGSTIESLPPDAGSTPESPLPTAKPSQDPQTELLCRDPPPVEHGPGGTVDGRIDDSARIRCF
jgi:hypothetical protein